MIPDGQETVYRYLETESVTENVENPVTIMLVQN
jgi:hypothetical protein